MNKNFFSIFSPVFIFAIAVGIASASGGGSQAPKPFQLPPQYVLEKIQGTVLILSKGTKKPEPAELEETVQGGDEIITRSGSEASLTLNETTMFHLSPDSHVKVAELTRNTPVNFITRLELAAGKILAQVEKLGKSHSVFEIEAGGVVCGVRGTAFEVQKDDSSIQTTTFEGVVEMRKGGLKQLISANHHAEFSRGQNVFQLQRTLTEREKAQFENWQKLQDLVSRRQIERAALLKNYDTLPQDEQTRIWQKVQQVKGKDRLKALRQILQEKNLQKRNQTKEQAALERAQSLKDLQHTRQQAQEQRELEEKK